LKTLKTALAQRTWFGRNAGLRPRLVLIVGIAMLAPGALAVLQAISSYGSSMRIIEQNLAQAAQLAASEEVNVIAASREILTSLAAQPDVRAGTGLACRRALQRAIGGLDHPPSRTHRKSAHAAGRARRPAFWCEGRWCGCIAVVGCAGRRDDLGACAPRAGVAAAQPARLGVVPAMPRVRRRGRMSQLQHITHHPQASG
jgi:hypothetical protein